MLHAGGVSEQGMPGPGLEEKMNSLKERLLSGCQVHAWHRPCDYPFMNQVARPTHEVVV